MASGLLGVGLVTLRSLGTTLADNDSCCFSMPPAKQPSVNLRTIPIITLLLVLTGGGTAVWCFRAEVKSRVRDWRTDALVKESRALGAAGDWKTAEFRALAAHQMAPDLLGPREAFFDAAKVTNSRYLLPAANAVITHPGASPEARIMVLEAMLKGGQPAAFVWMHQKLDEGTRGRDEVILLLADFLIQSHNLSQARQVLEARLRQNPDHRFTAKLVQVLLLPGWAEGDRIRAHRLLGELAPTRDQNASFREAVSGLAAVPLDLIQPSLLPPQTADWLEGLANATAEDRLLAARLRLAALPAGEREAALAATVQRFRSDQVEPLARWLFSLGRADFVLGLIDETRGQESANLFGLRLRALQTVQGSAAVLVWLEKAHPEADPIDVFLTRAACQADLDLSADALGSWQEILHLIEIDPARAPFGKIYFNALDQGQLDVATRILLTACHHPETPLPPAASLTPVMIHLQKTDRLKELQSLTETLLRREEANPVLVNNSAYCCFLFGQNREAALSIAAKLVEAQPEALSFRTTLAFGQLVANQPEQALATLSPPSLDWSQASPADLAIRAATLQRNGRTVEAAEVRTRFDAALLSDEERRLLAQE